MSNYIRKLFIFLRFRLGGKIPDSSPPGDGPKYLYSILKNSIVILRSIPFHLAYIFLSNTLYWCCGSRERLLFFFFFLFTAASVAYGSSQARGHLGAAAADLCHSHSNTGSESHLRAMPQLVAMPDS